MLLTGSIGINLFIFIDTSWSLNLSLLFSVCSGDHRLNVRNCQLAKPVGHDPDDVRTELSVPVLEAKSDGVVAWCAMPAVVTMSAEDRQEPRARLADDPPSG